MGVLLVAHIEKYQASACGHMCEHYERKPELERGFARENIDPTRTDQNYNLAPTHENGQVAFINERIESLGLKRKPRKDAVRMCDCVLTMPQSLDPALRDEFFAAAYEELSEKFGEENVVSSWVHLDESQPHMHFAWVPVTDDGRLCAKEVVSRPVLQRLHTDLQVNLERALGVPVEVVLDEKTRGDRAAKYVDMPEFKAATERLECLRQEIAEKELEPAAETLSESARTLYKARNDRKREQGLREANESLRSRISELEEECSGLKNQARAFEREIPELERGIRSLEPRLERLRDRVAQAIEKLGYVPDRASKFAQEMARALGKPVLDRLQAVSRWAREQAQLQNERRMREQPHQRHSHGRGLGR